MLLCIKACYNRKSNPLLSYERYIRLQSSLRKRRRELLLFCHHPPTLTAGIQARPENLLISKEELKEKGIVHLRAARGGDYTAHEPGQCVIYPHIDLRRRGLTIQDFLKALTEITIQALKDVWQIETLGNKNEPGLYRITDQAKIAAMGVFFKSFFTSFGLAVNVANTLSTFSYIHPCGQPGLSICSVKNSGKDTRKIGKFIDVWQSSFENWLAASAQKSREKHWLP